MQSFDFKKLLPHLYIVGAFIVVVMIFCFPALQGKQLSSGDNISWKAMYHEIEAYHDSTGINPLWTNSMFGGMPGYTIGVPETNNYVGHIQGIFTGLFPKPAYFLILAMLCFYILTSVMRIDRWLGAIGALAYAFATYNIEIIVAGHETKMLALAYMPAVLAGLILIYRGRWLSGSAVLGISLALMVSSNHFQVLYYAMIMIAFYVIAKLVLTLTRKENIGKFFISSAIAGVVAAAAVGTCMSSLLTTQEYAKATMRGGESELTINHDANKKSGGLDKDYAFYWSSGVGETFSIMIPYLYGGSLSEPIEKAPETEALVGGQAASLPLYWGPQAETGNFAGPVYFGAVICFLFVLGMIVVRSPHKWWMLAVSILALMMSWGKHLPGFNYWLFDNLPLYNKFRTPTIILVLPQMLFPLIGIWGLSEILKGKVESAALWKNVKIAAGITAGICVLLGLGGSMFFNYTNETFDAQLPQQIMGALKSDRASLATKSALTSAVYIILAAALIWAFTKQKINRTLMIGGIGLLVAIDLVSVASNYIGEENYQDATDYEAIFHPRQVDQQIMQDKDPYYRVLDLTKSTYNDAIQAYYHKCIGGYSPAKMEIYQDLIDMQMGGAHSQGKFNAQVLNMLNTKYIIFNGPQQQPVYQPNPGALGNAWFVDEVKWAKSADEEMTMMNATALGDTTVVPNGFDPKHTVVIRNSFEKNLSGYQYGKDSTSAIRLTRYGLNDLSFVSNNTKNGVAVFSDIYYEHGWEAYVDGKQVDIMRANYVLRAIKVPAGQHTIEFHFRPSSFKTGNTIAMISSIFLIGILLAGFAMFFKGKEKVVEVTDENVL